jgi:hypothetical protein
MWFRPSERNILYPRENDVVLLKSLLVCVSLSLPFFDPLPARSFYSSRSDSYIETQGPIGGPEVVETLYSI